MLPCNIASMKVKLVAEGRSPNLMAEAVLLLKRPLSR